jgi:hypothetical protein
MERVQGQAIYQWLSLNLLQYLRSNQAYQTRTSQLLPTSIYRRFVFDIEVQMLLYCPCRAIQTLVGQRCQSFFEDIEYDFTCNVGIYRCQIKGPFVLDSYTNIRGLRYPSVSDIGYDVLYTCWTNRSRFIWHTHGSHLLVLRSV